MKIQESLGVLNLSEYVRKMQLYLRLFYNNLRQKKIILNGVGTSKTLR